MGLLRDARKHRARDRHRSPPARPERSMSFLRIRNLQKTYADGTRAVKGFDLDVEEGEFIVLLGPSGCGKTTTLRMVAGLETATCGEIVLVGSWFAYRPPSAS